VDQTSNYREKPLYILDIRYFCKENNCIHHMIPMLDSGHVSKANGRVPLRVFTCSSPSANARATKSVGACRHYMRIVQTTCSYWNNENMHSPMTMGSSIVQTSAMRCKCAYLNILPLHKGQINQCSKFVVFPLLVMTGKDLNLPNQFSQ